jgi:sugar phosphate isomerase/epimerase
MRTDQIALQMYTVRDRTAQDFAGTLRQVAEMGYRAIELAGYGGLSAADLKSALDENGLRAMAAHVAYAQFVERAEAVCAELKGLGCDFAIVPALPQEYRTDETLLREAAANFNRWGAVARDAGLRFAYHNHAFEFAPLANGTPYDILVGETDPDLVKLELDLFWAQYGGVDPVALTRQLGARASLLHVKDMAAGEERADTPVGTGIMPWPELLAAGAEVGAEWYIVEQDHPKNSIDDVRTSLRNLEGMAE